MTTEVDREAWSAWAFLLAGVLLLWVLGYGLNDVADRCEVRQVRAVEVIDG